MRAPLLTPARTRAVIPVVTVALTMAACSDSDSSSEAATPTTGAAEVAGAPPPTDAPSAGDGFHLVSVGHGEDGVDGHDLAVGANTPTDPQGRLYLHNGDRGPDVETLQARLIELGAPLPGTDGIFGDETLHALLAFQSSEGLTADGVVGTNTWAMLDAPTTTVAWEPPDLHDDYATETVPATHPEPVPIPEGPAPTGDGANVGSHEAPAEDPATASTGVWAKGVISLSTETATFYDDGGNVVLQAPISSGKDELTPEGTFHVQSKSERAWAQGNNGVYMDDMTRFNGGIGFHSIPKRADGSDIPTPLGQQAVSHGCVRMADEQAKLVFENLPIGAVVEVHQ